MVKRSNVIKSNPFDDIQIIGIVTTLPDFQLTWNINRQLNIDLAKQEDIYPDEFMNEVPFSFYFYDEGENQNIYDLILLSSQGHLWIKIKNKVDYYLIIRNAINDEKLKGIINIIKKIDSVVHAFMLDMSDFNKKEEIAIYDMLEQVESYEFKLLKEKNKKLPKINS